jgi:anti-sigma B factor antagonist
MNAVQVSKRKAEDISTQDNKIIRAALKFTTLESGVSCVSLFGRLDILGVQQIESNFALMTSTQRKSVIIDLARLELMSSIGLGMLISNANNLYAHGKRMVVLNPQKRVERVIRMAGLDQILPIVYSVRDAFEVIKVIEAA